MRKKLLSIFLSFTLIGFTSAPLGKVVHAAPISGQATKNLTNDENYAETKTYKDGNLDITILKNNNDDMKFIINNTKLNRNVETTLKGDDKQAHISLSVTSGNRKTIKNDFVVPKNTNTNTKTNIESVNPQINNTLYSGTSADWFVFDGLWYITKEDFNHYVNATVPYSHLDYMYYNINVDASYAKLGNSYVHTQIGRSSSSIAAGMTGAAIGTFVGSIVVALLPGVGIAAEGVVSSTIQAALSAVTTGLSLYLASMCTDERGCIWIVNDINPTIYRRTYNASLDCWTTWYCYSLSEVGPYVDHDVVELGPPTD